MKYGWTEGCEGCNRMRSGMSQRPHAGRCRKRMEEELKGDDVGRRLLEEAKEKEHKWLEDRHIEEEAKKKKGSEISRRRG